MRALTQQLRKALRSFHEDEEGMETIQVVMLVAIAALVLITLKLFWKQIKDWAKGLLDKVTQDTGDQSLSPGNFRPAGG